ncbi:MAG: hypothetical protein KTR31_09590 [Myxococcales bacterium]|nr:hypothetical protein [Myxococcales bacterium]
MLAGRRLAITRAIRFGLVLLPAPVVWAALVWLVYDFGGLAWLRIPFVPLTVIGTAVAFYLGFKNNAAYDRFWEGRKIWGAVVNESRSWANGVLCFVRPGDTGSEAHEIRRVLIHRHLAWINALRVQLRKKSRFFDKPARGTRARLEKHATHMRNDWDAEVGPFLSTEEHARTSAMVNPATHIVAQQGQDLARLVDDGGLDLFRQIALQDILRELYTLQGKCERIKNTPLPRQYSEFGRIFTRAFVYLVPFGMLDVFGAEVHAGWPTVEELLFVLPYLASVGLVAWVFITMDLIGDASEDPFERSMNDVPMNALCRAIERDLRQLLGETELPDPEQPIDGILY